MTMKTTPQEQAELMAEEIAQLGEALREAREEHDKFVNECLERIPESYDCDDAGEAIILKFISDMDTLGGLIAKLTSGFR